MILHTIAPQLTTARRQEPLPDVSSPFVPVGHLARDVDVIDAGMPCPDLAPRFASGYVSSVAVVDRADPARIGLVSRERFQLASSGTLGYGRALLARRPVGEITDWEPLCVHPGEPFVDVVGRAMRRGPARRFDDVLVAGHVWGVVATADLVRLLVESTRA